LKAQTVNSDLSCEEMCEQVRRLYREHRHVEFSWHILERTRSDQQRKAIEVFCRQLAWALNDAGMDQRKVFALMRDGVQIPWRQQSVKDSLWRQIQKAVVEKDSSTRLTTSEVDKVYSVLNRWLGQEMGIHVPFPSAEVGGTDG